MKANTEIQQNFILYSSVFPGKEREFRPIQHMMSNGIFSENFRWWLHNIEQILTIKKLSTQNKISTFLNSLKKNKYLMTA